MMMSHAGIQYEDCRFGFDTWPSLKPTMVGGSVPNLEFEDGSKMGSTNAMMRMVGAKYGYYPEDPMKAYQNDFLTDLYYDHFDKFVNFLMAPPDKQAEQKDEQIDRIKKVLGYIEPFCGKTKFLVGDNLCVCDFWIGGFYTNIMSKPFWVNGEWDKIKGQFPKYTAYGEAFKAANQAHIDARPDRPF